MSYDVCMLQRVGEDLNVTYNLVPMFIRALGGDGVKKLNGMTGCDALIIVEPGITHMTNNKSEYEKLNPENGWGNYNIALEFLHRLAKMCSEYPYGTIKIS